MIWFTSDTHFGHENALRFCNRPWDSVEKMGHDMIAQINGCVTHNDDLYVLGDFSFKLSIDEAQAVREQIVCRKVHLIPGNHDKDWSRAEVQGTFIVEPPIHIIKAEGRKFVLCHYPILDWPGLGHGSIHLHGHIHAPAGYNKQNRNKNLLRYDVGVDANGYAPVSLESVLSFFDGIEHARRISREQWEDDSFSL